ncbi:AprI/Inh family metalloprotease inhibitor [Chelativorans sp. ZYF759]|uniref:protease inhibitor Inh/omp19 family protein n=1 Tax=Chelativorans sp. ZYF759 TaxID=2692213 RepID=UPI00145CF972|nr:protease inhibitor Inh/omp19 family protein [Chelativorans sp. ZYF759]NMG38008.1 AprI/Inh family metalloprotease inhibitor [Chelativorans sp. ZYF759]
MNFTRIGILTAAVAALTLAGCTSERFSGVNTRAPAPAPAPLMAAPTGQVQTGQLPPPGQPGMSDASQFPAPPGQEDDFGNGEFADTEGRPDGGDPQMASLPPQGAQEISAGSVAGVWNASVGGQSCRIATPQTRFGEGFRAGPLRCPAPLDQVKSWNVSGSQLTLYDESGSALARLFSSSGRFEGQTSSGQSVSLVR